MATATIGPLGKKLQQSGVPSSGPTNGKKKRKVRQRKTKRFSKLREDLQVAGVIDTTPEGAVRNEVVDPSSQSTQDTTGLDRTAINRGWEVPEHEKRRVIDRLLAKIEDEETSPAETAMCANALIKADQIQFERDHPEEAAAAKGTTNQTTNIIGADFWERLYRGQQQNNVIDVVESKLKAVECEQPTVPLLTEGATDANSKQPEKVPGVRVQDTARAT